jgi:CubicO group peptidase (beta-lactamase class C family)
MAVVVLELTRRQELQLDQPITRWLAHIPAHWQAVTLHQLLSHTSGLGHWGDVPGLPPVLEVPPGRNELVDLIAAAPLVHPPGAGWRYSGPGFLVAGLVVEAVTGRTYGEVAVELVFGPAGMTSTTSGQYPVGSPDVAVGHHQGQPVQVQESFTQILGTGDLWTTTADLIRFSQALRSGALIGQLAAARLWTPHAELARPAADGGEENSVAEAYGYGTFLGRVAGNQAWFVPGDNPGYQSLLAYLPDRNIDLVVLGNEDAPGVAAALRRLTLD